MNGFHHLIGDIQDMAGQFIMKEGECIYQWVVLVWKQIWFVFLLCKCSDIDLIILGYEDCSLVIISSAVVRRREDGNHWRKLFFTVPLVKLVASLLALVRPNDCF